MVRKGHQWPFKEIKICFLWLVRGLEHDLFLQPHCDPLWVLYCWVGLGSSLPSFSLFLHFASVCCVLSLIEFARFAFAHTTPLASLSHWTISYTKKIWISYPKPHAGYLGCGGGGETSFKKAMCLLIYWILLLWSSERKFGSVNMGEGPEYRPFRDLISVPQHIGRENRSKSRKGLYSGPFPM